MRMAYADPPYLGCGAKHYGALHENASDADELDWHRDLIRRLESEFSDGWALSLHTPSLGEMQRLCSTPVRVGAWVKPFASFKPGVNPAYAWEPLLFGGGRKRTRAQPTVRDWIAENITLKKGLSGAKPPRVCRWILSFLNFDPETDSLEDIFPGTGVMGREVFKAKVLETPLNEIGGARK